MKKCILFAPIAEREVRFYLEFAEHSKKMNWPYEVQFLSFFQGGNELLLDKGYKVWDIYDWSEKVDQFKISDENLEKHFEINNLHKYILHEKITFGVTDNQVLYDKYYKYLNGINLVMNEILKTFSEKQIQVFQELGGFIAPFSLMFVCKKLKINHVFFEPSFFKGTMNFIENNYVSSFLPVSKVELPADEKTIAYLQQVKSTQQLVIPQKDTHHYQDMGLSKIFNASNIKKLYNKLYLKYVKKQRQEYEWIFNHVFRALRQYFNRKKTQALYSDGVPAGSFIYFPFHVQLDFQLTLRNPEYLNQLAFVEFVCQILPKKYKLVVKEHPASIGGFNAAELTRIVKQNENLVLLQPMLNTYEILKKTSAVITINSKVGAEAASLGHLVACMGHGFYWNSEVVSKLNSSVELTEWLEKLSRGQLQPVSRENIEKYFSEINRQSYSFELYNFSKENIASYIDSLKKYTDLKLS